MRKIKFKCEHLASNDTDKLYLYGDVIDNEELDPINGEPLNGISPNKVKQMLDSCKTDSLEIHVNSYGGSVFGGVAIYNMLRDTNKHIVTVNDGISASAASLILMAGHEIRAHENSMVMIHRASSFGWGNCEDFLKLAETLEKLDNTCVLATYKNRFKGSDEELEQLINNETWLTPDEALKYGFVDKIVEDKPEDKPEIKTSNVIYNFLNLKLGGTDEKLR